MVYHCEQCDYQGARAESLQDHVKSKHEGIKYQWQQCDYKAIGQANLRQHIKSIPEGIKYECQQCDYRANFPAALRIHKETKHSISKMTFKIFEQFLVKN